MFRRLIAIRLLGMVSSLNRRKKGGGSAMTKNIILYILLFAYVALAMAIVFGSMFSTMASPLASVGLDWLYFSMALLMAFAVGVIFSIFATQSQLYEAKDNETLLCLPIRPATILASRMVVLWLTVVFTQLMVLVPAYIVWKSTFSVSSVQVVCWILGFLGLPFLCLALSCALGWLLAKINSKMRRKTLVSTVLSLVFLGLYLVVYTRAQAYIQLVVANSQAIGAQLSAAWSPLFLFGDACAAGNVTSLLYFLLWCAAPFALIYWLLSRSFIRIATTNRGQIRIKYEEKTLNVHSAKQALLRKELNRFTSSSVYMINSGLGILLKIALPIVLVIKRQTIFQTLTQTDISPDLLAILLALGFALASSMDCISAPSISLEGQCIWIPQSLPVKPGQVLAAKVKMHAWLCVPVTLLSSLVTCLLMGVSWNMLVPLVLSVGLFALFVALLGVTVNLRYPRLDWLSETVAVKQGASVIVTMMLGWVAVGVPAALYFLVLQQLLSVAVSLWLAVVVLAGICWLLWRYLQGKGAQKFATLG